MRPIPALPGALVLAGGGQLPDCIYQTVMGLAGGNVANVVVVSTEKSAADSKRWSKLGAVTVTNLRVRAAADLRAEKNLMAMLNARVVWLADPAAALHSSELFRSLLTGVMRRGGVLAASGPAAGALVGSYIDERGKLKVGGFGLLPFSVLLPGYKASKAKALAKALPKGSVAWFVPKASSLVVHHGRRVGAVGKDPVTASIMSQGGWAEAVEEIERVDYVEPDDRAPYSLDLLAWLRAAQLRRGPVFPPSKPAKPKLAKGTLLVHGGRRVSKETFDLFIEEAGGKKANIVCIPSATKFESWEDVDSFSAKNLRKRGAKNVTVLHTADSRTADLDAKLLEPLSKATGVWIDGGRTYLMMDSYQHTRAHKLMRDVLKRGGIVAGSSAGCQVVGDFLVRGNPRSNKDIFYDGYQTGFALIEGVILDAHFRQRKKRTESLYALIAAHPQMLGVGVDENTALLIRGSVGEVIGENAVSFFDHSNKKSAGLASGLVLQSGAKYNLATRKRVN